MYNRHLLKLSYVNSKGLISGTADIRRSSLKGNINIADNATIINVRMNGDITIGRNTSIFGGGTYLFSSINPISIGSFCSIARNVTIQEYFHNYRRPTTYNINRRLLGVKGEEEISKGPINIGSDVWIGTGAVILSGVRVGVGSIIGANAVVTKDVPPYSIVAGVPAKVIDMRFSDAVKDELLNIEWWNKSTETLKNNHAFFELDLRSDEGITKLRDYKWL